MGTFIPGWGKSPVSRKWHWFDETHTSLCGKIGFYFGPTSQVETSGADVSDDCAECRRRKAKLPAPQPPALRQAGDA